MTTLLLSLSTGQAAALVAVASGLLVLLATLALGRASLAAHTARRCQQAGAVLLPLAIAYCTYWYPAWSTGSDYAQYDAWAPIGVTMLFIPGLLVSLMVAFLVARVGAPRGLEEGPTQPRDDDADRPRSA